MNVNYLNPEDIIIECYIRNIDPTEIKHVSELSIQLLLEESGQEDAPTTVHESAYRNPRRELEYCQKQIGSFRSSLSNRSLVENQTQDAQAQAEARLLHLGGRMRRLGKSKRYGLKALEGEQLCKKLLSIVQCSKNENETNLDDAIDAVRQTPSLNMDYVSNSGSDDEITASNIRPIDHYQKESSSKATQGIINAMSSVKVGQSISSPTPLGSRVTSAVMSGSNVRQVINPELLQEIKYPDHATLSSDPCGLKDPYSQYNNLQFTGIHTRPLESRGDILSSAVPNTISSNQGVSANVAFDEQRNRFHFRRLQDDLYKVEGLQEESGRIFDNSSGRYIPPLIQHRQRREEGLYRSGLNYDGSPGGMAIGDFIFRLERIAKTRVIPSNLLVDEISTVLKGVASDWYWCHLQLNPVMTWDQLRADLIERFQDRRTDYDIRRMVEARKQQRKESIIEFYNAILALTVQSPVLFPDTEILHLIRRNMRSGLQIALAHCTFKSIGELLRNCVAIEDTWSRLGYDPDQPYTPRRYIHELQSNSNEFLRDNLNNSIVDEQKNLEYHYTGINAISAPSHSEKKLSDNPRRVQFHDQVYAERKSENNKSQTEFEQTFSPDKNVCWNCYDRGHQFKDCAQDMHVFCFGCGRTNVKKFMCSNCNSGNYHLEKPYSGNLSPMDNKRPRPFPDSRYIPRSHTLPHTSSTFRWLNSPSSNQNQMLRPTNGGQQNL